MSLQVLSDLEQAEAESGKPLEHFLLVQPFMALKPQAGKNRIGEDS